MGKAPSDCTSGQHGSAKAHCTEDCLYWLKYKEDQTRKKNNSFKLRLERVSVLRIHCKGYEILKIFNPNMIQIQNNCLYQG